MKRWREMSNEENFDGNAMIPRRWSYFSKMEELSDHGVACSDLGILWGMNSNSMPATFWLFWHMMQDGDLLTRARVEANTCRMTNTAKPACFDVTKLCSQPLLQSSYAEALRLYVAVYIIRKPEHENARILDDEIPKDKMIVVSSAMAHMDKRNWKLGPRGEHPVEKFWADRFLTYGDKHSRTSPASTGASPASGIDTSASTSFASINTKPLEPKFSLNGYSGAWIPFGGGIHQCPGRHWVKTQMLLSFAMISAAFEIDLLGKEERLRVDMSKYGLGALQPAEKVGFRIRRRNSAS